MKPRRAIPGLVILTLAGVAALLALARTGVDEDSGPASRGESRAEAPGAPRLEGVGSATPSPAEPEEDPNGSVEAKAASERALYGVVRSDGGTPIEGASVYVGDKYASEPEKGKTFRKITTDAQGRWSLESVVVHGHWICAVADGYLPAHLDGDRLPAERPLVLELEPGPEIQVAVTGLHGKPLEKTFYVYVQNAEWGRRVPGPGGRLQFRIRADVAPGEREATIRVCTRDAVEVHGHYPYGGWRVEPKDQRVQPPAKDVVIRVLPRCVLDLRVFDAETGQPLSRRPRIELSGRAHFGHTGERLEPGHFRGYPWAPLGTYGLRIEAAGYRAYEGTEVTFHRPGEVVSLEVRLERDPTVGDLRVSLPILPTLPPEPSESRFYGEAPFSQARFLWRVPEPPGEEEGDSAVAGHVWVGHWGRPRIESGTDYVFEDRPAGEVGMLVFNVPSKRVAYAPHVRVQTGRSTSIALDLEPGVFADPASFASLHERIEGVTVRHPRFGVMPTFIHTGNGFSWGDPGENFLPSTPLGPYPGPEVTVELQLDEGEVVTRTFRVDPDDR